MRPGGLGVKLFLTCWLVYGLHFATNIVREIYPALSLGDHLSFDVSEYVGLHPDIFEIPGRGAFINNNPGASVLGAIPYALTRPVIDIVVERVRVARAASGRAAPDYETIYPLAREFHRQAYARGLDVKFGLAAAVMQALLMAPLSALSAVVMYGVLISLTGSARASLALALVYAFATPVFYRTAQLNQNVLLSHSAFFAFVLLWQPWTGEGRPQAKHLLGAGLLAGWCVVLDYSGVVALVALGAYAYQRSRSGEPRERAGPAPLWFAAGALASLSILFLYQWAAFGNPFLPAQSYMPTTAFSRYGLRGMGLPQADLLWDTAFGMRFGLFSSAPILLLALYPPAWLAGRGRLLRTRETWFALLFTAAFLVFCSANEYGRLQFNSGVRYAVPVAPFLFLIAAGNLLHLPSPAAAVAAIVGTYWSWCLAMYRDVEQGLGVLESLRHVTLGGLRLPWLSTLERMGYVRSEHVAAVVFLAAAALLLVLWRPWSRWSTGLENGTTNAS